MLVASAMRRTASNLNSLLYFLAFFPIGLPHYGRYVSPIFSLPRVSHFWGPLQRVTGLERVPLSAPLGRDLRAVRVKPQVPRLRSG
jgi:hypothetical protein